MNERLGGRQEFELEPGDRQLERQIRAEFGGDGVELRRRPAVALMLAVRIAEDQLLERTNARNVAQLDDSLDALKKLEFSKSELDTIDRYAREGGIDLWRSVSVA